jgi:hypothetical protein
MKIFNRCRKRNAKALVRLGRQRAFTHIIERLAGHRGGKTFMVDTAPLKVEPPSIYVTERFSPVRLFYIKEVAALVAYNDRKLKIEILNNSLTYIIY